MNDETMQQKRNLNPTAEAIIAMCIWSNEYAAQGGGSADFYESLSPAQKQQCTRIVDQILQAPRSYAHATTN
jgi:hypothetical protein